MSKKGTYLFVVCICLSLVIIGATYAYFTAKATDDNTVHGNAATVTFGLRVERVTTVDMAFGLVPMKNNQAPAAASNKCYDDSGNAGCQLYRIIVTADSDTAMFLDGYVSMVPKSGVETRVAAVYTDDEEESFYTKFTPDDFIDSNTLSNDFLSNNDADDQGIISGIRNDSSTGFFSHENDADCFLISNKKIGGDIGRERIFYMMIWVFDNGRSQDNLQGMQLAYSGSVTFVTAQGNEISASFD